MYEFSDEFEKTRCISKIFQIVIGCSSILVFDFYGLGNHVKNTNRNLEHILEHKNLDPNPRVEDKKNSKPESQNP